MSKLLTILALMIAAPAFAVQSLPVDGEQGFSTQDQAAQAALATITETKTEMAGGIYSLNGKFYYTQAVGTDEGTSVHNIHILFPHGGKLVALYHTHPCDTFAGRAASEQDNSVFFSEVDVDVATRMGVTSYIRVLSDGSVHRFVPGTDKLRWIQSQVSSGQERVSLGTII